MIDEALDVDAADGPTIFGADLHECWIRDYRFAPIARYVWHDRTLDCPQQRRLSVVAASDEKRHAAWNTHSAPDPTRRTRIRMRDIDFDHKGRGRLKGQRSFGWHGSFARAALSRKDGPLTNKGDEAAVGERTTNGLLVLDSVDEAA